MCSSLFYSVTLVSNIKDSDLVNSKGRQSKTTTSRYFWLWLYVTRHSFDEVSLLTWFLLLLTVSYSVVIYFCIFRFTTPPWRFSRRNASTLAQWGFVRVTKSLTGSRRPLCEESEIDPFKTGQLRLSES